MMTSSRITTISNVPSRSRKNRKSLNYKKKLILPIDIVSRQEVTTYIISKKRKLIVDEETQINMDQVKSQMKNSDDTLMKLDIAPPTYRTIKSL